MQHCNMMWILGSGGSRICPKSCIWKRANSKATKVVSKWDSRYVYMYIYCKNIWIYVICIWIMICLVFFSGWMNSMNSHTRRVTASTSSGTGSGARSPLITLKERSTKNISGPVGWEPSHKDWHRYQHLLAIACDSWVRPRETSLIASLQLEC